MLDNVKVEQRDREAYHRLAAIENSNVPFWASTEGAWLLSGDADNTPQIQAFARHRLAALAWRQPMSNDEDFEDAMALYEATANAGSRHRLAERDHMAPAPGEVDCAGPEWDAIAADALANSVKPVADMPTREELVEMLREVRFRGLIYWEPNTDRGTNSKRAMIARIDALLAQVNEESEG